MSRIQSIAPQNCKRCKAPDSMFIDDDRRLTCRLCGWKVSISVEAEADAPQGGSAQGGSAQGGSAQGGSAQGQSPRDRYVVSYGMIHPDKVDSWTRAKYESGLDAVQRDDIATAIDSFHKALEGDRDFLDAHLWLARLQDDPELKRKHYGAIVAYLPNHEEALRELMVLNGQMTPEEASRSASGLDPIARRADVPVQTDAEAIRCEQCGSGDMDIVEGEPFATCNTCGYQTRIEKAGYGLKSLSMALVKQRGKAIKWDVGERFLQCESCSAQRTLPPTTLNTRCPFCGSSQVIERDALDSFIQPDGIVPFMISREEAGDAIREALNSRVERLKGIFMNNKVERGQLTPMYLPFWYFDVILDVRRTITRKGGENSYSRMRAPAVMSETISEAESNLPIPGFSSPERDLIRRLGRFELSAVRPYDARILGKTSAELYTLDWEAASLEARGHVSRLMRQQYGQEPFSDTTISVTPLIHQMQFRLVLCPVWIANMIEADGDLRVGLIHGQTGRAVLGRARQPD